MKDADLFINVVAYLHSLSRAMSGYYKLSGSHPKDNHRCFTLHPFGWCCTLPAKQFSPFNPQVPDGVYKPPLVYCRMGFINTFPFHLSRNAAIVSESLKISDQRMAKRYWAVFIHKQPLEGFRTLVLPPLDSLSPLCIADFQVAASSRKMET